MSELPPSDARLRSAAQALIDATGRRCNVCTGWSPSWDGHDRNPPCEHQAREDLRVLLGRILLDPPTDQPKPAARHVRANPAALYDRPPTSTNCRCGLVPIGDDQPAEKSQTEKDAFRARLTRFLFEHGYIPAPPEWRP